MRLFTTLLALLALAACATAPTTSAPPADEPRLADDIALDDGRKPEQLVAFAQIAPGMRVADIAAGRGYTTEVLARAVGPAGVVYGQNSKWILEKFAEKPWSERLARRVNRNVVRVDRDFDDPLPAEAKDLDVVVDVLFYHDTVWLGTDRAAMNAKIFAALKPGGRYVIVDHSAIAGHGVDDVQTLHRIEESVVVAEVLAAGFVADGSDDAWRNPSDDRTWNDAPGAAAERRGKSDRFALRFVKPK